MSFLFKRFNVMCCDDVGVPELVDECVDLAWLVRKWEVDNEFWIDDLEQLVVGETLPFWNRHNWIVRER